MTKEHAGPSIPLTGIYLDLPSKTVVLAAKDQLVASVRLTPEGLVFQANPDPATPLQPSETVPTLSPDEGSSPTTPDLAGTVIETEKPKAVTLQGKLKNKPRVGRPDSRGNPTAWARFAAHEDDRENAHMYSATFHKHTASIALGLEAEMPLTLQGYPHEHDDPGSKRMDTLSVITLLDYPGKKPQE